MEQLKSLINQELKDLEENLKIAQFASNDPIECFQVLEKRHIFKSLANEEKTNDARSLSHIKKVNYYIENIIKDFSGFKKNLAIHLVKNSI